jgi:hypothetical protein
MVKAVTGPSTKKHKKGKPLKGGEKQTVVNVSDEFSGKCQLLSIKIITELCQNSCVFLYQVFLLCKEQQDSSKLTTPSKEGRWKRGYPDICSKACICFMQMNHLH